MLRISVAGQLALEVACGLLALPVCVSLLLHFAVWFPVAIAYAFFVDSRVWPTAAAMLLALLCGAFHPDAVWVLSGMVVAVLGLNPVFAPLLDRLTRRGPP